VFGVWTQRSSLQRGADKLRARVAAGDASDVTWSFIGSDINITAPESSVSTTAGRPFVPAGRPPEI
jgi:hypothetical protein